jgi:hypothetical protein
MSHRFLYRPAAMIGGFSLVAIQAIHVGDSATDEVSSIITSP